MVPSLQYNLSCIAPYNDLFGSFAGNSTYWNDKLVLIIRTQVFEIEFGPI